MALIRFSLEGLVDGPEPAHVGAGREHEQPDDGQAEVGHAPSSEHPREAANQIHRQCGAVHCNTLMIFVHHVLKVCLV